jgi:hypothetical protein
MGPDALSGDKDLMTRQISSYEKHLSKEDNCNVGRLSLVKVRHTDLSCCMLKIASK